MKTHSPEQFVTQPIAKAYVDGSRLVSDRFAHKDVSAEFCLKRSKHGASRSRLASLVQSSMRPLELSVAQLSALEDLQKSNSVVAVTGQQVGLFGGPMHTIYKIRTAVEEARRITATLQVPAVAIFWLEDNDHDAAEASSAQLLNTEGAVIKVTTWDGSDARRSVSARNISTTEQTLIQEHLELLSGQYANSVRERASVAYATGVAWTDAFLTILQPYLSEWGVLVVRGSDVVAAGMHLPILLCYSEQPHRLRSAILEGTQILIDRGLTPQASVGEHLFFGTDADGRTKGPIDVVDARQHPELFTPTVLMRPIVQDAILPSVVSILGAAELSYHAQLLEAYNLCGVEMPVAVLRNGATLLDAKTERLLSKDSRDISWYRQSDDEVERAISDLLTMEVLPSKTDRESLLEALIAPYRSAARIIDQTLVGNVGAQGASIRSTLEAMEGKLRSAAKRSQSAVADRMRTVHTIVYPHGTLQERAYPLLFWEARFGTDILRIIADCIAGQPPGSHVEFSNSDLPF